MLIKLPNGQCINHESVRSLLIHERLRGGTGVLPAPRLVIALVDGQNIVTDCESEDDAEAMRDRLFEEINAACAQNRKEPDHDA